MTPSLLPLSTHLLPVPPAHAPCLALTSLSSVSYLSYLSSSLFLLLSFPIATSRKHWQQIVGKIWSNPLCSHLLTVTKETTAERLIPEFADELFPEFPPKSYVHHLCLLSLAHLCRLYHLCLPDEIWSNPLC